MKSFTEIFNESSSNIGDPIILSEVISVSKLLGNTDADRTYRGKFEVKTTTQPRSFGKRGELQRLEYTTKAKPSVEQKTHHGYVVYDRPNAEIHELFCDCKDFRFRTYAPFVKNGLATWDLSDKYKKRLTQNTIDKSWTDTTNPSGKLYLCKHLYRIISKYI